MVTVKHVDVQSAARISAFLTAVAATIFSAVFLLVLSGDAGALFVGFILLVIGIGVQAFFAAVIGAIAAYIYNNFVVPNVGGLKIKLDNAADESKANAASYVTMAAGAAEASGETVNRAQPVEDQELIAHARQLIKDDRYAAAYDLLMRVPENATAQAWLARLDEIDPTLAFSDKRKKKPGRSLDETGGPADSTGSSDSDSSDD